MDWSASYGLERKRPRLQPVQPGRLRSSHTRNEPFLALGEGR